MPSVKQNYFIVQVDDAFIETELFYNITGGLCTQWNRII